ncbi:MAG TPA: hypothetical protein VFC78_03860 [Tepidisphaeraceae bacterium]|nr:hypothetical protein [Tepidisphaeraceae bacterium]
MTTAPTVDSASTAPPSAPGDRTAQSDGRSPRPSRRPAGRVGTVVVLILSLVCAGVLRQVAINRQIAAAPPGTAASRSTLGNMNSFALALLLGGLRGPLVMFLWSSSENQKANHDLEDLDTKIEWIRLLQPEFDTVHMFQIWNKAYNISVMMASPANKFTTIMEALEYAQGVDEERPGDINILDSQSDVYANKLGNPNLPEHPFYDRQFREESLAPDKRAAAFPNDRHYRRLDKSKPLLDEQDQIRAELITPTRGRKRPANVPASSDWNDGSQLQYLKNYGPFPDGIAPIAMSYNYAKRAEVALNVEGQDPLQFSAMVVDSRPALQLKGWAEAEVRFGREREANAFGINADAWNGQVEEAVARVGPAAAPANRRALDASLQSYKLAGRVARNAIIEYERHLANPDYMARRGTYISHEADMQAIIYLAAADAAYLSARLTTDKAQRDSLLRSAMANYQKGMTRSQWTVLEFETEQAALHPLHLSTAAFMELRPDEPVSASAKFTPAQIAQIYNAAMTEVSRQHLNEHSDDQAAYGRTIARCQIRMREIASALHLPSATAPATQPAAQP